MSIFEFERYSVFSLPPPIPIIRYCDGEVEIDKKIKGEKEMELTKELLDEKKAKLDAELNTELETILITKKEELAKIGELAKEQAIANATSDIKETLSDKFAKAYDLLDGFYALLPVENVGE